MVDLSQCYLSSDKSSKSQIKSFLSLCQHFLINEKSVCSDKFNIKDNLGKNFSDYSKLRKTNLI